MSKHKAPIVAIVGRANVGKSSLFNAVLDRREAIVANEPGTTRDSIMARASIFVPVKKSKSSLHLSKVQGDIEQSTESYTEYDEGVAEKSTQKFAKKVRRVNGSAVKQANMVQQDFWLVDTAGMKNPTDDFEFTIQEQILQATDSADLIIVMVEANTMITEEDRKVAKMALKSKKPVILIVNKSDKAHGKDLSHFERLGIKPLFITSVTHRDGIGDIMAYLAEALPKATIKVADDRIRIALLGRPNVGKSALFNSLSKKQQAIVADRAGTTRDINRTIVKYEGKEIELLDTAGIRRSGKIEKGIEQFSVIRSLSAIEQADVCLLLIDANDLSVQLDQKIAGMIKESGTGLIFVVSKWDSVEKDAFSRDLDIAPKIVHEFDFVPWAPLIFTSSVTGKNVTKIYDLSLQIITEREKIIKTTDLNKWLRKVVDRHPPAGLKNRLPKLNYIIQETDNPTPAFKVFGSHTKYIHWSYKRMMDRQMREAFGYAGTPIEFWFIEKHDTHKHGLSPTREGDQRSKNIRLKRARARINTKKT